jgi:Ca2+-binding RTX toxin-like protein
MKRARTLRVALGLAAAVAAISVPTAAEAATVLKSINGVVSYGGEPGENNDVKVTEVNGVIVFEEASVAISPHPSCAALTPTKVGCAASGVDQITMNVTNGINKVVSSAPYKTTIDGAGGTSNEFKGGPVQNLLLGGYNHDVLTGGAGPDEIQGDDGSDYITGLGGADELIGGVGGDIFFSPSLDGADLMDGGANYDIADYSARTTSIGVSLDDVSNDGGHNEPPFLIPENDDVRSTVENVKGGSGNDALEGSNAGNRLEGGGGSDLLAGRLGADGLEGGPGEDTVSYAGYGGALTVDLDGESGDDGLDSEQDTVGVDVERLLGGSGPDQLTGNASANVIRGGAGNDLIDGLDGADELFGDDGDDTLTSQDGLADADDCGAGTDTTVADALDARLECELPVATGGGETGGGETDGATGGVASTPGGATAPTVPTGPLVSIGPSRLRLDRPGYASLRVSCPVTANLRCSGTLSLTRTRRGRASTLGSRRFSIAVGRTATVSVRVTRALRRALRRKSIRVRAIANARDAVSASRTSQRTVTLRRAGRG